MINPKFNIKSNISDDYKREQNVPNDIYLLIIMYTTIILNKNKCFFSGMQNEDSVVPSHVYSIEASVLTYLSDVQRRNETQPGTGWDR